jgi:hypothetical protein
MAYCHCTNLNGAFAAHQMYNLTQVCKIRHWNGQIIYIAVYGLVLFFWLSRTRPANTCFHSSGEQKQWMTRRCSGTRFLDVGVCENSFFFFVVLTNSLVGELGRCASTKGARRDVEILLINHVGVSRDVLGCCSRGVTQFGHSSRVFSIRQCIFLSPNLNMR